MTEPDARRRAEDGLRHLARLQVRTGLHPPETVLAELVEAIEVELPGTDPQVLARAWIAAETAALRAEAARWPEVTGHDRLVSALTDLRNRGVAVRAGVADRAAAGRDLDPGELRGVLWFTHPDVWHSLDHGVLEVTLCHPDLTDAVPGDDLLSGVLRVLARHQVPAAFERGRLLLSVTWQARP
ncbi:DUF6891 domain-containing protein [Nocardioides houyundeii]|uniref:DUF6891 domain-containing protein n=1 Tax=Nocardioides houyundeii TaxID=2045452 RepID=UPI000C758D01|nr:hypothetical protein [Nocardioides houyundeii]